jgi:hypothetical protein
MDGPVERRNRTVRLCLLCPLSALVSAMSSRRPGAVNPSPPQHHAPPPRPCRIAVRAVAQSHGFRGHECRPVPTSPSALTPPMGHGARSSRCGDARPARASHSQRRARAPRHRASLGSSCDVARPTSLQGKISNSISPRRFTPAGMRTRISSAPHLSGVVPGSKLAGP